MLHTIDTRLILAFDAVAAYLQEKMGVTMALILREISMAMLAGFAFLFYTLAVSGDVVMIGLYLVFGMAGLTRLVADYRRHQADTQKDWTETLARKYLIQADLKRTAYAQQRFIVMALISVFGLGAAMKFGRAIDTEMLSIFILFGLYVVREYATCAHPRPPASRNRQTRGSLGFSAA